MSIRPVPAFVAAAAVIAGAATSQVPAGTAAPAFEFKASLNGAPASFADFEGKLVVVEFFATW